MSAKIIDFPGITSLDRDPDRVLESTLARYAGQFEGIVILGKLKDGDEYFTSSIADGAEVTWMLERAKHKLMRIVDQDDHDAPGGEAGA